jgi:glucose/mannose-6-phosphate isomerase
VVAGMGGSALAAEFVKNWIGNKLPVAMIIMRDYTLPAFVGAGTLVVVSSYSGNTEETLSSLEYAEQRGAKIVVMTSGGQLLEVAKEKSLPHFELPGGLQPRMAVLYGVKALVQLFESIGFLAGIVAELESAGKWVSGELKDWMAAVPAEKNTAKQIAKQLVGHPIVVYGGPMLRLPAMKWKIDANENAKNLAFYNYFPESNHNEFLGWGHPNDSGIKVIELRSSLDLPHIQKRFDVTNKLRFDKFTPIEVFAEGKTKLEQMLWTLILGDFVMVYLAFLNGIDPTPVDLIEELKAELDK